MNKIIHFFSFSTILTIVREQNILFVFKGQSAHSGVCTDFRVVFGLYLGLFSKKEINFLHIFWQARRFQICLLKIEKLAKAGCH